MSAAEKIVSLDVVRQAKAQAQERPRMQDGFIAIPNAVFDAAFAADLTPTERDMLFSICRKTYGFGKQVDDVTISQLADYAKIKRQNASPAFNALLARNIITAGKGAHGFMVSINHPDSWKMEPEEGQRRKAKPKAKAPSEFQTTECISDMRPSEIQTHNRQPQKTVLEPNGSCHSAVANDAADLAKQRRKAKNESRAADKLVELFHHLCPSLPRISMLSDTRKQAMKLRWIQAGKDLGMYEIGNLDAGLQWWTIFFQVVEASDFLSGRVAPSGGREKPFRANIDWLLKQANFVKIVEGNYDNEVAK